MIVVWPVPMVSRAFLNCALSLCGRKAVPAPSFPRMLALKMAWEGERGMEEVFGTTEQDAQALGRQEVLLARPDAR